MPLIQPASDPRRPDLRRRRIVRGLGAGLSLGAAWPIRAQPVVGPPPSPLPLPTGKVLLSVSGGVSRRNSPERADFDRAMLEAMPQQSFSTRTPWFTQARRFSGPLLRSVLMASGAQGTELEAIALNAYKAVIPIDDAMQWPMLVATRLDGEPMLVRDKGPLFIVYPYDSDPELRSERYYSRSAWQLRRLVVR